MLVKGTIAGAVGGAQHAFARGATRRTGGVGRVWAMFPNRLLPRCLRPGAP
jgi:hypothetical protein